MALFIKIIYIERELKRSWLDEPFYAERNISFCIQNNYLAVTMGEVGTILSIYTKHPTKAGC